MPVVRQILAHDFALFASGQPPGSRARVHGPKRIVRMHGSAGLYVEMLIPKAGRMKVRQLLRPLTNPGHGGCLLRINRIRSAVSRSTHLTCTLKMETLTETYTVTIPLVFLQREERW